MNNLIEPNISDGLLDDDSMTPVHRESMKQWFSCVYIKRQYFRDLQNGRQHTPST